MATVVNPFGKMQGWNKITINLLGRDVVGISELSYSDTTKKENAYGAGNMPVGRTEGNYEAKASITLYKEEVDAITKSLPSGKRLQDIEPFDIIVLYDKKGEIRKDRINYCEFTGNSVEVKQNDGSISVKCELIVSHIDWNI
ncbi:hypothetical protein [Ornithobacterium rhinotracheale]|uniref:Phage tail protein n=1 Tax=Ornithobacterium rhinotracheale (strain ATCC 51463 / DSM 15997 / CCUG 23171 / CIP 104009 / LMG 9086) TaxID=867902 RepID=I4A342_ORNRL|nr:hypothetical protein [Ornithobacterium rhinotracheale]AFL98376.1 hypothetical protein Ornrh_2245 [Ornithobacterium rhinotracheale DSM 15997]AIQ00131.1 hypothetical protein Q785_11365 [Ornithobacterium rhinotracheale ORT-UMN 88]KGB65735.1 hypothetical protein Q787_10890 [Ornithobacterium rhinotracheale H06-030791]MBN3662820.1 hypothetical protein [Ornithobacterium rhinotracheale]MCK0193276.1 hypothetical protein [Ornithobacterium rhinotracheale]